MKISIMQPGYLPWLGFFDLIARVDVMVIYDSVKYDKQSWRNRNRIRTGEGKDGWKWLTVPVGSKAEKELIKDVKICNETKWAKKHWGSIYNNYRFHPYFHIYADFFNEVYKRERELLIDLDLHIIEYIKNELGLKQKIVRSSTLTLKVKEGKNEKLIDVCETMGSKFLYDSAGSKNFIDLDLFEKKGIKVEFQDFNHPIYIQKGYKTFIPYLSVIDLLFHYGHKSIEIIMNKGND